MRVAVAQTRPFKGDILRNIETHVRWIRVAAGANASHIIFPELSVTGYEPTLAASLAMRSDDVRMVVFQSLSDRHSMTIGLGAPTIGPDGILISMLIFRPGEERQVYSKRYLHTDEEPFFACGGKPVMLEDNKLALAICYELSVPKHSEDAHVAGAEIYLASVAKTAAGIDRAGLTLAEIARKYSMLVLVSNAVGDCDNFVCGGGSAIWNKDGNLLARLGERAEGLLLLDTETGEIIERQPEYESQ